MATVNSEGTLVAIYRGKLMFNIYKLDAGSFEKKSTIDLNRQIT